jgi:hypothetical protein
MADFSKKTERRAVRRGEAQELIRAIRGEAVPRMDMTTFIPYGPPGLMGEPGPRAGITLDELEESITRSYDLSITSAGTLNIPVIGSAEGGFSRRVVVLERAAFKRIKEGDLENQYGYAIRLCLTVNNWKAGARVSLPFLAAYAELGQISAQWMLQIMGLAGPKVDSAILPPTELNVEKFVIAKQSLEKIIESVRDPATIFKAMKIATILPPDSATQQLKLSAARAYALSSIERGWSLGDARDRLESEEQSVNDTLAEVYQIIAGSNDNSSKPSTDVRKKARELLGRIRVDA